MRKLICTSLLLLFFTAGNANNINLTNLGTTYNASSGVVTVNFDLSWENSWRSNASNNWDAAWIFFKYKDGGQWLHLNVTGNDITLPSGFDYFVPTDKRGIFVFRNASNIGVGNVSLTGCEIGVLPQMGTFDIKAFALEMVNIPTAHFYVGDGEPPGAYSQGGTGAPFLVTGNGLTKGNTYAWELNTPNNTTSLDLNFPTGVYSFYMMKYELSSGGYRDFLNTLTYQQQGQLMYVAPNSPAGTNIMMGYGTLSIVTPGVNNLTPAVIGCNANNNGVYNEIDDGECNAHGNISIEDMYTFLDWSALRPMTDLEYEKSCRGPLLPVPGAYAWGTGALIKSGAIGVINPNRPNEIMAATGALNTNLDSINFSTIGRSLRNGIFATSTSSRWSSGAGYYGAMDLTGNLCELVINCYNIEGVKYNGSHGDGSLGTNGYNTNWPVSLTSHTLNPGASSSVVTMNGALNARGGSFYSDGSITVGTGYGKVSYIIPYINSSSVYAVQAGGCSAYRQMFYGIRGVRSVN